jgi:hypothetical protein
MLQIVVVQKNILTAAGRIAPGTTYAFKVPAEMTAT